MQSNHVSRETTTISLGSTGDLIALVPVLLGFHPSASVVVGGFAGAPVRMVGPVARYDIDAPAVPSARHLLDTLAKHGAQSVFVLVYPDEPEQAAEVVAAYLATAEGDGSYPIGIADIAVVIDGRWRSALCEDPYCCPPEGREISASSVAVADQMAASTAVDGRAVLPSRDDLTAVIAASTTAGERIGVDRARATAQVRAVDEAGGRLLEERVRRIVAAGIAAREGGEPLDDDDLAFVAAAVCRSIEVRDDLATMPDRPLPAYLDVLCAVARATPDDRAASICGVIALVALRDGQGALANVAVERAVKADPDSSWTRLMGKMTALMPTPRQVQEWAARARAAAGDAPATAS